MNNLRLEIKALETKYYSLKTKVAKSKVQAKIDVLELELFHLVHDQVDAQNAIYSTKKVKALVKYDSKNDDCVFVYIPEFNQTCHVSICNDINSKSWYSHLSCIEYTKDQEVELDIVFDASRDYKQNLVCSWSAKKIYGGIVNETQYNELCNDGNKYAFFKYPNSNGVTGLFE